MPDEFLHELLPAEELGKFQSQLESDFNPIDKIQSLISQLPLDQPMDAREYVMADDELIATEMPTDEEIIAAVMNCDCDELEETVPVFIDGILCFLEQQADGEFAVDDSFVRGLKKLRREIGFKDIALRRQVTLDNYISSPQ